VTAAVDEWGEPSDAMGDRVNPRDVVGHLLIVWVVDYIAHSPTKYTQPNKPSDVIVVDVCDLDLADDRGFQGLLARKVWWRQARLIASLKEKIGQRMLCQMSQGTGTSGFNAPFELINMISDPQCRNRAEAWINAHPNYKASTPGRAEMMAELAGFEQKARIENGNGSQAPPPEKSYLERLAEQASQGAERFAGTKSPLPPPPPPPQSDMPGF